ncbi:amino acid permease [Streptomyces formicae]|uniref:Amino acid permease n=1 Tax=Streptomyces formicae TaxID=1616117 RepID=A0ABY3WRT0_9ACTN|nr:amino acid permease [Streptomyces formicae]UNM14154.1 amino acid permease [Streptomyces formicae]
MSDRTMTAADTTVAGPPATGTPHVDAGDAGYRKDLKSRHINMIAIGGAIGTGLFLGAGGRMANAGPSLFIAYAVCGVFAFFVVRALGELVLYRPSSGAFVSYAREFMGEKGAYTAGWLYFLNWSTTAIADITAAATYAHFWAMFSDVPQWILALIALAVVLAANLISVKYFGEMEFWFAIIKVGALVAFMLVGIFLVVTQHEVGGHTPGLSTITDNGGIFPLGVMPMMLLIQGVVFAYASVELCGVAAGETENPQKIMPKAINSIMWRVGLFYVGSVVLLALLLPYTAYSADQSPFVTLFDKLGIPGAAGVMNLVVLTAALSSLNSGLYSTGRILRSMSVSGSAPKFTGVMNKGGVPYGGILLTAGFGVVGVFLNYVMPGDAFELVLNFASIGIIGTWGMIMVCSLLFWHRSKDGRVTRPGYRLPWAPYTQIVTLVFLASVLVLMWMDGGIGRTTVNCLPLIALALVGGWYVVRKRVGSIAARHKGADVA